MSTFQYPSPIIDAREKQLISDIARDYNKFASPGPIAKGLEKFKSAVVKVVPTSARGKVNEASLRIKDALSWKKDALSWNKAVEVAGKGFVEFTKQAARITKNEDQVLVSLREAGCEVDQFEQICALRSYDIEPVTVGNYKDRVAAFAQGGLTGAAGLPGVPLNLALIFFLFFRATQNIALHFGFNPREDPRELEIASEVTLASLAPNLEAASGLGGLIQKMMFATEVTALQNALKKYTYEEMAKRGAAELLYVQIRALANRAAKSALERAGKEGLEASVFRRMLEQVGRHMPKRVGQRVVPIIGGLVGGFADTYYMSRVLRGGRLFYHKRFLHEKEKRVGILRGLNTEDVNGLYRK